MYYTYVIISETSGRLYIGQTQNLEERLHRHNTGRIVSTRNRGPWNLIFHESFKSRAEANVMEKKLKFFKNRNYLLKFIKYQDINP